MKEEAGIANQPGFYLFMLMGGIVIHDDMHIQVLWDIFLDLIADSGGTWTVIPNEAGQGFRRNVDSDSA